MATTLVTNGKIAGALNGTTSSAIDTTGASLIVISVGQYDVGSDVTLATLADELTLIQTAGDAFTLKVTTTCGF